MTQLPHNQENLFSNQGLPNPLARQVGKEVRLHQLHGSKNQNKHKCGRSYPSLYEFPATPGLLMFKGKHTVPDLETDTSEFPSRFMKEM